MQSSCTIASSSSPFQFQYPLSSLNPRSRGRRSTRLLCIRAMASRRSGEGDEYYGGRRVDEDMIVLRLRIQEMKRMERGHEAPSDWLDWEKRCYGSYDSVVCEAMGVLQTALMNSRPSFALGIIALLALTVPLSTALLLYHFLQFLSQG